MATLDKSGKKCYIPLFFLKKTKSKEAGMYNLEQVMEGLCEGRSFERRLDVDGGMEYVTPAAPGYFIHSVAGLAHGGWGGSAELPMKQLMNGHFPKDGWREHARR